MKRRSSWPLRASPCWRPPWRSPSAPACCSGPAICSTPLPLCPRPPRRADKGQSMLTLQRAALAAAPAYLKGRVAWAQELPRVELVEKGRGRGGQREAAGLPEVCAGAGGRRRLARGRGPAAAGDGEGCICGAVRAAGAQVGPEGHVKEEARRGVLDVFCFGCCGRSEESKQQAAARGFVAASLQRDNKERTRGQSGLTTFVSHIFISRAAAAAAVAATAMASQYQSMAKLMNHVRNQASRLIAKHQHTMLSCCSNKLFFT